MYSPLPRSHLDFEIKEYISNALLMSERRYYEAANAKDLEKYAKFWGTLFETLYAIDKSSAAYFLHDVSINDTAPAGSPLALQFEQSRKFLEKNGVTVTVDSSSGIAGWPRVTIGQPNGLNP